MVGVRLFFESKFSMAVSLLFKAVSAAALMVCASSAFSHVSLAEGRAPAGSTYRAALRIGHGCGVSPTTAIKVILPAGFKGAKPMPKAGWTLAVLKSKLAQPYDNHGTLVTEEYLMTLERKAFCSLLTHPKTQERIMGMMSTGKPVRN